MANREQLRRVRRGRTAWNEWRDAEPGIPVQLEGARLRGRNLSGYNLSRANMANADLDAATLDDCSLEGASLVNAKLRRASLRRANLQGANLNHADLVDADLFSTRLSRARLNHCLMWHSNLSDARASQAHFRNADLASATLTNANLNNAKLVGANLNRANLEGCRLNRADLQNCNLNRANMKGASLGQAKLQRSTLVETSVDGAILKGSFVYGVSAWAIVGTPADETELVCTAHGQAVVTVDRLVVAQFIHLLLTSERIRDIIESVSSKLVLILGRFTRERKFVLDGLREGLRKQGFTPVVFDFTPPATRDVSETVSILAHLARIVIADLTDPRSVPHELEAIVPRLPSVTFVPLLAEGDRAYGMFTHIERYPWVKPIVRYTETTLIPDLVRDLLDAAGL